MAEMARCRVDPAWFVSTYGQVYDATARQWVPFRLWPAQVGALSAIAEHRLLVALKARQLGMTWLVLSYALWLMLFRPAATVLLFSKRDDEAIELVSRLRGMFDRLPDWLRCGVVASAAHDWRLVNGSRALAFPTTGGRSYTATMAIVDEADFAPDLDALLGAVKPTIDAGGRLVLLSTVDKSRPESAFKRVYWSGGPDRAWFRLFLGWNSRPDRDLAWYEVQKADILARTGGLDGLHQEYPASDAEALAPRTSDVRFPAAWLALCSGLGASVVDGPAVPGLECYAEPGPGRAYVIAADPAEGNPQSDESAATVLEWDMGVEVASLAGRFDPAVFAAHLAVLSERYNDAAVLVERNNHGHAVLLWLADNSHVQCLAGLDGKEGWLTTSKSKTLAFDAAADRFRAGDCLIRSAETLRQLQAIEGSTLDAPEGQHDDRAMSFVLALAALHFCASGTGLSAVIPVVDPVAEADRGGW